MVIVSICFIRTLGIGIMAIHMNSKACEAIELQLGKSLPLKYKFLIFHCTLGRLLVLTFCEYKPDMALVKYPPATNMEEPFTEKLT